MIGATVLLAAATVGSAWCAYQAALWNGVQTRNLAAASIAQVESLRKNSSGNMKTQLDVTVFLDYIQNVARGEAKIADFIRRHARPEFRPALEAWIKEQTRGQEPVDLPFTSPQYQVADMRDAAQLELEAASAIDHANTANSRSDLFVLHTVLFALSLFFLGTIPQLRRPGVRRAMLALGALVFALTLISMARIPLAPSKAEQLSPPMPHRSAEGADRILDRQAGSVGRRTSMGLGRLG